jgi:CheY-like chemotaxis protein
MTQRNDPAGIDMPCAEPSPEQGAEPGPIGKGRSPLTRRTANDLTLSGSDVRLDRLTVLVAEDNVILSMHLCQILEKAGAAVMGPYPFCADAIMAADRRRPDLAVLDHELSGGDSGPLAARLAALSVPFAYFTGYSEDEMKGVFEAAPIVPKPASDAALLEVMASLLPR